MSESVGRAFVNAVAARDHAALASVLGEHVDFKGLTPGRFWEGQTPAEVLVVVLGSWFDKQCHVDEISSVDVGRPVGDTQRIGYRFEVTNGAGPHSIEQQAYYRVRHGRITYLRVVCSGFRPRSD